MNMKTSIVILTLNEFAHTLRCLESIREYTLEPYELIVVDNGSTDLTLSYMRLQPDVVLIENSENVGFAKGCNQGAALATGDHILYLNNDTIVTSNWLTNMLKVLHASEDVGMVGPFTNYSSAHQGIKVTYTNLWDLNKFAAQHAERLAGTVTEVRRLVGFCMLLKRSVQEEIGGFDERYGLGNYEDDDLCLRTALAGYRMLIANDAFIHHVGHVTTNQLEQASLSHLLQINRSRARSKWGIDIFDLIYKADVCLSFCIYMTDWTDPLYECVTSIQEIADEIIIINSSNRQDEVELPVEARWCELAFKTEDGEYGIWKQAQLTATKDYVLLMHASEYLGGHDRRQLRALKRKLDSEVIAVIMKAGSLVAGQAEDAEERIRLIQRQVDLDAVICPKPEGSPQQYRKSTITINKAKIQIGNK